MPEEQPNNPLHGITLKALLEELVDRHGWAELARRVPINCFSVDPSINSSLKFLRKTEWARVKVEALYLEATQRERNIAARDARAAARAAARAEASGEDDLA